MKRRKDNLAKGLLLVGDYVCVLKPVEQSETAELGYELDDSVLRPLEHGSVEVLRQDGELHVLRAGAPGGGHRSIGVVSQAASVVAVVCSGRGNWGYTRRWHYFIFIP